MKWYVDMQRLENQADKPGFLVTYACTIIRKSNKVIDTHDKRINILIVSFGHDFYLIVSRPLGRIPKLKFPNISEFKAFKRWPSSGGLLKLRRAAMSTVVKATK